MPVVSDSLSYRSIQQDNIAWKLLHAQNAPFIIAILDEHLGGDVSRRTVAEMTELVEFDLEDLRERILEMPLSRAAKDYLEQWRHEGYLIRKPNPGTRQETYELSGGALAAIGFVKGLARPHRTATKSRLGIIFDQISSLAIEMDTDDEKRRDALLAERQRIDDKLRSLDEGVYEAISETEAREKALEIIELAREIPQDFASVSAEFERISKNLFAKLISYDDDRNDMLADVFAGVDHISQSPEGQSFRGFYELLQNSEESERLYDQIEVLLAADFSQGMSNEQRHYLRNLIRMLLQQSRAVNETMTDLARSLRRFVQSQSFQEDRVLKRLLDQSLSLATTLTETHSPGTVLPLELELTSTRVDPVSRMTMRDPADETLPEALEMELQSGETSMSLEELREQIRDVEIDFEELIGNVNTSLATALENGTGKASVGSVLEAHPATQGVASVIGLMMLADEQGRRCDGYERVSWQAVDGTWQQATIENYEFIQEVE